MEAVPIFGERDQKAEYVPRPSAYALLPNSAGLLAVVKTDRGHYLPGGGLEAGESADDAVRRECMEECGIEVRNLRPLGAAVQFLFAPGEGWFRLEGDFFIADSVEPGSGSANGLRWIEPSAAAELMSRAFERWAIETWLDLRPAK